MYKKILFIGLLSILFLSTVVSASIIVNKPSIFNRIRDFFDKKGTWQCTGKCIYNGLDVSDKYNCVPEPSSSVPDEGYNEYSGEKPQCVCIKKNPGECKFYDSNYGSGTDNLQCGGSCPPGLTCASYKFNGRQICNCTKPADVVDCGFHFPDSSVTAISGNTEDDFERACYGWCENTKSNDCKFYMGTGLNGLPEPKCDCYGKPTEDTKCGFHFGTRSIVSEQDYINSCYGWCDTPENVDDCVYWRNSTDFGNTWKPACTCRKEQQDFKCTDTDGGINYIVKGTCHDTQDWIDVCDTAEPTYLWEMRCDEIGVCSSVRHNCKDDGMVCKDGACVASGTTLPSQLPISPRTDYTPGKLLITR